ncbi:hypothetical protein KFL_007540035 [Klebsormidium nitens]|uniref:Integrase catalytic domain-containing protein n=1 Tax=Klebsormidium nitens TaxID=105231 RepID=A0A1Y1IK72_KLENI|nr:hypothetical protein KFL_007540035 [Klebsormidium nitens]|eukprot:GAQ91265.1 hypothetical protein KFL_007540035 [Klebsormidium nitens]
MHDLGGHPSIPKTRRLIKERFFWKRMYEEIRDYIATCAACQMTDQPTTERTDGRTLTSTEVDLPLEKVGFDLLGPFPRMSEGFEYVYIWYDYFFGWIGAGLGRSKDSKEVAAFLKMDLFAAHACPAVIVMDNDACVGEVKELCDQMGSLVQLIIAYCPRMNGGAEASVKLVTKNIRKLILQHGLEWATHIFEALLVVRICYRTATRLSPFEIIYGRLPVLPAERLLQTRYRIQEPTSAEGEARAEEEFDGALVIMKKAKREHKFDTGWEGPYRFLYFYDEAAQVAVLEDQTGQRWTRHIVMLHPYQPRAAAQE